MFLLFGTIKKIKHKEGNLRKESLLEEGNTHLWIFIYTRLTHTKKMEMEEKISTIRCRIAMGSFSIFYGML
jgi:hypothetical protein